MDEQEAQDADESSSAVTLCPSTGKIRHPSRRVALENLRRFLRLLDGAGRDRRACGKLDVYWCAGCGGFHCGNRSRFDAKAMKAKAPRSRGPREGDRGDAA